MGGAVAIFKPTAAAVFTAGDAQNSQFDIPELHGWLCSPADSIRHQLQLSFQSSVEMEGTEFFSNPLLHLLKTIIMFSGAF